MKKAVFLVLNKTEYLDDVLKTLLDCGVRGATILNSTGMGRMLADEVPLFASLGLAFQEDRPYNYTIFAVMNEEKVDQVIAAIEDCIGDLTEPGTGILMVLPVERIVGLAPKNNEL